MDYPSVKSWPTILQFYSSVHSIQLKNAILIKIIKAMLLMKEVMREQLSVIKGHRNGEDLEGEGQAQDLQVSWKELQNSCLGLKGNLSPKDLDGSYDISINLLVKGSPLLNNAIRVFFLLKRKKKKKLSPQYSSTNKKHLGCLLTLDCSQFISRSIQNSLT